MIGIEDAVTHTDLGCQTAGSRCAGQLVENGAMILYHTTTTDGARSIQADGFRGSSGTFMFSEWFEDVVFLAIHPVDENEGAKGGVVLRVEIDQDISEYLIEEEGLPPWEYTVPAPVLNSAVVSIVALTQRELEDLAIERAKRNRELPKELGDLNNE